MKIGDNEKISIWHLGNTGVRNPMRIQDGSRVFASSSYVGDFHGKPAEIGFTRLMNEAGIVSSEGKDGTIGRKWRLMFERYGFMYRIVEKSDPYTQDDLGSADSVTPFGRTFISADTLPHVSSLPCMDIQQIRYMILMMLWIIFLTCVSVEEILRRRRFLTVKKNILVVNFIP